jgi:hypothetical protein
MTYRIGGQDTVSGPSQPACCAFAREPNHVGRGGLARKETLIDSGGTEDEPRCPQQLDSTGEADARIRRTRPLPRRRAHR